MQNWRTLLHLGQLNFLPAASQQSKKNAITCIRFTNAKAFPTDTPLRVHNRKNIFCLQIWSHLRFDLPTPPLSNPNFHRCLCNRLHDWKRVTLTCFPMYGCRLLAINYLPYLHMLGVMDKERKSICSRKTPFKVATPVATHSDGVGIPWEGETKFREKRSVTCLIKSNKSRIRDHPTTANAAIVMR